MIKFTVQIDTDDIDDTDKLRAVQRATVRIANTRDMNDSRSFCFAIHMNGPIMEHDPTAPAVCQLSR